MTTLSLLLDEINDRVQHYEFPQDPVHLYDPLRYILNLGGKHLRPALTYLAAEAFSGQNQDVSNVSLGIEFFHNFSLIHDDIMDDAPLRRGERTIHEKWSVNTAILSGDAMLVEAYKCMGKVSPHHVAEVMRVFSKTAQEVCEGQQMDVDFESRENVSEAEYIQMIQYKTSVLLGCALQLGAIVSGSDEEDALKLYEFGLNVGTSFQIKDDYLDAFGDPEKFGKAVGGDIITNKKTILLIHALETLPPIEKEELQALMHSEAISPEEKVDRVKRLFKSSATDLYALDVMKTYHEKGLACIDELKVSKESKEQLYAFADWLYKRDM